MVRFGLSATTNRPWAPERRAGPTPRADGPMHAPVLIVIGLRSHNRVESLGANGT